MAESGNWLACLLPCRHPSHLYVGGSEQFSVANIRFNKFCELAKAGMTYSAIAIQLNTEKRPTQTGSVWFPATVSRTLNRK
jgi:hypothetical protein